MKECSRCNGSGYAAYDKEFDSIAPEKGDKFIDVALFPPCPVCRGAGEIKEGEQK
jgi:RecJ-like exonuclease